MRSPEITLLEFCPHTECCVNVKMVLPYVLMLRAGTDANTLVMRHMLSLMHEKQTARMQ